MKKSFYSAAAGVLLLAGTGAASAVTLIGVSPGGVEGYLSLANFGQGAWTTPTSNPSQTFTLLFDYLSNPNGGATTLSFLPSQSTATTIDLFNPSLGLEIDPSSNVNDPQNPAFTPSNDTRKLQASWFGTVTSTVPNLTFGDPGNPPPNVAGTSITINYNGFSLLGRSFTGVGTLTLTVQSDDYNTLNFSGSDLCTSGSAVSLTNVCFTRALYLIDQGTANPGVIDGVFFVPVPEPASLALMGIGIAGLGIVRRKKAA